MTLNFREEHRICKKAKNKQNKTSRQNRQTKQTKRAKPNTQKTWTHHLLRHLHNRGGDVWRQDALEWHRGSVAPEGLEVVVAPALGGHDVHDHVPVIEQDPPALRRTLGWTARGIQMKMAGGRLVGLVFQSKCHTVGKPFFWPVDTMLSLSLAVKTRHAG